tara:strand:- start:8911 stop:11856 length:2946 start_codon:yes stop_codon:yes gene_type:complete
MAEVQTITLSDIRANPALNKANVQPGDTYTVGEDGSFNIKRVYSKEGGAELGIVLTEEMLKNQPELSEMGVEVGDRYLEDQHKIIKTGSDSSWKQFWYGFDETPSLLGNVADILESWFPIGMVELYTDPEKEYGEGWSEADNKTQRAMTRRADEREIFKKYGRHFTPDTDSVARTIGQFTGAVADPTTLIPFVGPAAKTATLGTQALRLGANLGIGGGLGGGYSAAEDLASGEDVDVLKALQTGALAAAGTGALLGAGKGISKLKSIRTERGEKRAANNLLDDAERTVRKQVASGSTPGFARFTLDEKLAQTGRGTLSEAQEIAGRKINVPADKSDAEKLLKKAVEDQAVSRFYNPKLEQFFGSISTGLGKISEPLLMRARKFEFDTKKNTVDYLKKAEPFMKSLRKMKETPKNNLARHLANGRFDEAEELMSATMREEFKVVRKDVLEKLKEDMIKQGLLKETSEEVGNYFPRLIKGEKEYAKLKEYWGDDVVGEIETKLRQEVKEGGDISDIPEFKRNILINQVIKGYGRKPGVKPKSTAEHARKIEVVTDDILPFYSSPEEALQLYIRNVVNSTERARFFGKGLLNKDFEENGLDESIGKIIGDEKAALKKQGKDFSPEQEKQIRSLLQSRFKGGEQTPSTWVGWLRDMGYAGTIANPISAITQLGDIGVSGGLHGFRNTIGAMFRTKDVQMLDVGLEDVAQEMADIRWSANALRKLFKWSGFKAVDRLGKETSMNAALRKNVKLLKTAKGEAAFRKKWGKFYGADIDNVIEDILSESAELGYWKKFHAFNELSDMQPISLLEMTQKYIDHPDGRIFYALKTFTLKQYDIVRRNIVQEYARGNKKAAIKNAGLLAGYLTAANVGTGAVKDILMGRDPGLDNIPDKSLWALLGVYGFNQYGVDKYLKQGKATDWAINTVAPALPYIDMIQGLTADSVKDDPNVGRHLRALPLIGPLLYNWFGGGAEKYNERMEKARREG